MDTVDAVHTSIFGLYGRKFIRSSLTTSCELNNPTHYCRFSCNNRMAGSRGGPDTCLENLQYSLSAVAVARHQRLQYAIQQTRSESQAHGCSLLQPFAVFDGRRYRSMSAIGRQKSASAPHDSSRRLLLFRYLTASPESRTIFAQRTCSARTYLAYSSGVSFPLFFVFQESGVMPPFSAHADL